MSLQPHAYSVIPAETVRIARALFPKGNLYLQVFDTFGPLFQDQEFAALFAQDGQPAESPARLAMVLLLQFIEGLTDRQAADAVCTGIDWKYLLGLELTDTGFHHSVLSEFRARLVAGSQEEFLLNQLLAHFQEHGLLKARGRQRTDSTHVLGAIRGMTRLWRRNVACGTQCLGRGCPSLAAYPQPASMGGSLWSSQRRISPPGQ